MFITKESAFEIYISEVKKLSRNKAQRKECLDVLNENYNMSIDKASDLLTLKISVNDITEFDIFCIISVVAPDRVEDIFTNNEVSVFSKEKYDNEGIVFPITFQALEVEADQWLTTIKCSDLMKMRDARLINYNENTQRTLRRIVHGGTEHYTIAVNYRQVNEIIRSYKDGAYIPNTITINMPESTIFDYQNGMLVIDEIDHFDIIDGYHRYLALSRINKEDKNFDFNMELRIVCFTEEKAKQFIWQEDQKTKMKRINSDLMNRNDNGNQVVTLLNQSGLLAGKVDVNSGIINAAVMAKTINLTYFKTDKTVSRSKYINVRNAILDNIKYLIDINPDLLNKKWADQYTIGFVVACFNKVEPEELESEIERITSIDVSGYNTLPLKIKRYVEGGN